MRKYAQIKKKHHYVWSFHLKQWTNGKDIYYFTKKGNIACDSIKGLSCERGFYKINSLNKSDIEFIQAISSKSDINLQEQHKKFLNNFIALSHISNVCQNYKTRSNEANTTHLAILYNSLENLHSGFESGVKPVLEKLHHGASEVLNENQNMVAFCSYLGQQITRTKTFKEKSLSAVNRNILAENESNIDIREYKKIQQLTENNWWFLSFMLGINVGYSLYRTRLNDNHIFIVNKTNTPFITSDNPVVNIHSSLCALGEYEAPEELDLYFPISPRYAYMINNSTEYNSLADFLCESDVEMLNEKMVKKAGATIFGNSNKILESLKKQFLHAKHT